MDEEQNQAATDTGEFVSKSERKRELDALKAQAFKLVELDNGELARLPVWPELADAIALAKRLPSTGARKRQVQYIAKQLRGDAGSAIIAGLAAMQQDRANDAHRFHQLELLREQLLVADDPIALVVSHYPDAERSRVMQLVRDARGERQRNAPPRASRKLFKYLRELADYHGSC